MTALAWVGFTNAVASFALGSFVWRQCPVPRLGRSYALVNLTIGLFSVSYGLWQMAVTESSAYFWMQQLTFWGMWINVAFMAFVFVFLDYHHWRWMVWLSAAITCAASYLNWTGGLYSGVEPRGGWGFWPRPFPAMGVYLFFWHGELLLPFYALLREIPRAVQPRRDQIKYFLVAFATGYLGGTTNWPMWYGVHFAPHFTILITVYCTLVAYAIVQHQLIDIRIVMRRTILYSIATVAAAALYAMVLFVVTRLVEGSLVKPNLWSASVAACVVAILFHPLRVGVDRWLNRHFPRESLDQHLLREATGGFVHELKRPLVNISLPAQLALEELGQLVREGTVREARVERLSDRLRFIVRQSHEGADIIEALRDLLSAGGDSHASVDLKAIVESVCDAQEPLAKRMNVPLIRRVGDAAIPLTGHRKQLEIATQNILKNALEAAGLCRPIRPSVIVELSETDQDMTLRIFNPDVDVDPQSLRTPYASTKGRSGMGIGLTLVREIVRLHRGSFISEMLPTKGVVVGFQLPKR